MGGNARYASKGPDKRQSTCEQCGETFTHGKFSHPNYCGECRDDRRDADQIVTDISGDVDADTQTVTITVTITNENDVPYRDISVGYASEGDVDVLGYVRLEGHSFAAETAWVKDLTYTGLKCSANSSITAEFTMCDSEFSQVDTTFKTYVQDSVDEFLNRVTMSRGDPFDEAEIEAVFSPAVSDGEINEARTTVSIPSFLVDL